MTKLENIAGAGGGGCFLAGTRVQQQHGKTTQIQNLKVGDEVLSFDEAGDVHVSKVTAVHYHANLQPILRVRFWKGEVLITPNHWVLNQYGNFIDIGKLSTHDALVDGMGHLRPIIGAELVGHEPVWNLTVEPNHTFIANDIRVHNGGHRERFPEPKVIAGMGGGGGGKGGGGGAAVEAADSLQSRAIVSILDAVGEGRLGGLVADGQSIFLNNTPLQNPDGTYNFNSVRWSFKPGAQDDQVIDGISDIETPYVVNLQVKKTTPSPLPQIITVSSSDIDEVRVVTSVPSLLSQDLSNGNINGTTVQYSFAVSVDGGAYTDVAAGNAYSAGGSISGLQITATPGAVGVGATCSMNVTGANQGAYYDSNGNLSYYPVNPRAVVQPQIYTGTAWVNYGDPFTLEANYGSLGSIRGGGFLSGIASYSYYATAGLSHYVGVDSYTQLRFVATSISPGATLSLSNPQSNFSTVVCTISGKVRSKYQTSHKIKLPAGTTRSIRMTRLTADSTSSALQNDLYLDTYVEIINSRLSYPNTAMAAISVDSAQFSSIPTRSYLVDGIMIRVPANYDPVAKTYSGIWNGTYKLAVSSNPAWVLFDLLTNTRYGLGDYITSANIDTAALYTIGKYCDELVPDGLGTGTFEPRFSLNTQIVSQKDAYRVISDITSCFRGMTYWANSIAGFTQDAPSDPTMIYSPANVIDGMFNYTGTSRKDRHSVVLVTWNDPQDKYLQKVEYVESPSMIAKYGIRKLDTVAFGCTSRGQAHRVGKWVLYTEEYESNLVTFGTGIDSQGVMPGEIIRVADPGRAGKRMAGRIMGATTTSIDLDKPLTITSNATVALRMPDGTTVTRPLTNTVGTYQTLNWTSVLSTLPQLNAMYVVADTSLVPALFRVIARDQGSAPNTFNITAVQHDPNKFGIIEQGLKLVPPKTTTLTGIPNTPKKPVLTDFIYLTGSSIATKLDISWEDGQPALSGWEVKVRQTGGNWQIYNTNVPNLEIANVTDGANYDVEVRAVNILNVKSPTPATESRVIVGKALPPSDVEDALATYDGTGITLRWKPISDLDLAFYEVRLGTAWDTATLIVKQITDSFRLPAQTSGAHTWLVRALDTTGHYSTNDAVISLTVPVPQAPANFVSPVINDQIKLSWNAANHPQPIVSYRIKEGATLETATNVVDVSALSFSFIPKFLGAKKYWVAGFDSAGNEGTYASTTVTLTIPQSPVITSSFTSDQIVLNWTTPESTLTVDHFLIRYGSTWSGATPVAEIGGTNYNGSAQWGGVRRWWVTAVDINGNEGVPAFVDITISLPSAPFITQQVVDNNVLLYWTQSTGTLPIKTYEIRKGGTFATSTLIGAKSGGFTTVFETEAGDYTYWITGIDTADNYGSPASVSATVSQPPDFVLKVNIDSNFSGTKSNMAFDTDGWLMPVDTAKTWTTHFTSQSWSQPQDQIAAGFPYFIEPGLSPSFYEEIIDYGTPIASSKITVAATAEVVTGSPKTSCTISVKRLIGDAWTDYANVSSIFVSNFQFVKVRYTVIGGTSDIYKLYNLNIRIDSKLINDAGMSNAGSTDAVSGNNAVINGVSKVGANPGGSGIRVPDGAGTLVLFQTPFVDISALTISVGTGSTAKYALYDFVDAPYPKGFKVLLYDASGTRVSGEFSWSAKGY